MLLLLAIGNFKLKFTPQAMLLLIAILCYSVYTVLILNNNSNDGIITFMTYLPAAFVFCLDKSYQQDLLKSVTKWMCILLGVSLGVYLLSMLIPLPHTTFIVPNNNFYMPFDNYFFYIYSGGYENEEAGVLRFGSIFLEPGHLSMICFLMLFANRFQFKKTPLLWFPLICILISFSLTGYVLLLLGYIVLKIRNLYYMLISAFIIGGSWLFVTELWNEGDNPVNILIVQRLEFDKNKGIKGNNRTIKKTDYYFKQCVKDGRIITGVGNKEMGDRVKGAGFKIFLLRYGIIGTIFITAIYLLLINYKANQRYAISFLTMIILLFLQRAYPGWYSWLFFYTVGIGVMRNEPFFSDKDSKDEEEPESEIKETSNNSLALCPPEKATTEE